MWHRNHVGQRLLAAVPCSAGCCSTIHCWPCSAGGGDWFGVPALYAYLFDRLGSPASSLDGMDRRARRPGHNMLHGWAIALVSFAYLGLLFAIAFHADRRAAAGASIIANPWVYALSLAVYATTWTFYGSVGRAAASGIGFLPIYLGPTLMAALWWIVLRRMIRISKANRITSIADFIASRYGKSALLGGLASVVAMVGVVPYIALQLKAVSSSLAVLTQLSRHPLRDRRKRGRSGRTPPCISRCCWRHSRSSSAPAISMPPSAMKAWSRRSHSSRWSSCWLSWPWASMSASPCTTAWPTCLRRRAQCRRWPPLLSLEGMMAGAGQGGFTGWAALIILSMLSILCLPRQFQIAVVENIDEDHVARAIWVLPLYLLVINLFVLPIALAGLHAFRRRRRHRCRHVRAAAAAAARPPGAGAAGLHRRPVGGDRHDHRRDHCPQHHALQRPGDAACCCA